MDNIWTVINHVTGETFRNLSRSDAATIALSEGQRAVAENAPEELPTFVITMTDEL